MRELLVNKQYAKLHYSSEAIDKLIDALEDLDWCAIPDGELSLVFMGDDAIAKVHGEFLDDPTPTDVITFPGDVNMNEAGEICVSVDHAKDFAQNNGQDFSEELTLYIVHGWLHLAGFDDLEAENKQAMRQAEKRAMDYLKEHAAVPEFTLEGLPG